MYVPNLKYYCSYHAKDVADTPQYADVKSCLSYQSFTAQTIAFLQLGRRFTRPLDKFFLDYSSRKK